MKVLIIGGSGVIGYNILKDFLHDKIDLRFTYFKNKPPISGGGIYLDITKKNDTIKIIEQFNPDVVIHTVSITNLDLCENDHNLADEVNVKGTSNVIEGCKKNRSKLIFLSTSAVFDGTKLEYFEDDEPAPVSYYGKTKKISEDLVRNSKLPYLIIRIDQPYFWSEKWQHTNSVLRVLNSLRNKKLFKEIIDWYNTPTFIPDIVIAIKSLIKIDCCGIYHVVGSDYINRYNWALNVAAIFELDKNHILPITSDILNLSAKRVNVNLNNQKFQKETKIIMKGIKEGLLAMVDKEKYYK